MFKTVMFKTIGRLGQLSDLVSNIGILCFEFVSDFEIRISSLDRKLTSDRLSRRQLRPGALS